MGRTHAQYPDYLYSWDRSFVVAFARLLDATGKIMYGYKSRAQAPHHDSSSPITSRSRCMSGHGSRANGSGGSPYYKA